MDIIFNILTHDRLINKLLKKYPELNLYIRVYKASTFSALKTKSPSFMSALSNLLAPGLLAYCCYVNKIDIFFPPKEENKGWGGRFRPHHINTNINKKMDALFRIVNESIKKYQERQNGWPYINFPVYARTLALDDIQDAILENIDIFLESTEFLTL
ncbi:MAG: hypothetical protein GY750_07255 [Lentisphaerae bacterium]|nr:hypothetical protein [Lentisphaerota bacterium]